MFSGGSTGSARQQGDFFVLRIRTGDVALVSRISSIHISWGVEASQLQKFAGGLQSPIPKSGELRKGRDLFFYLPH